ADREADRGGPGQAGDEADHEEEDDADQADRAVLPVEVGLGALLDRPGDLLHPRVARIERENPAARNDAVDHRGKAASQGKPKACRYGSCHYLPSESVVIGREIVARSPAILRAPPVRCVAVPGRSFDDSCWPRRPEHRPGPWTARATPLPRAPGSGARRAGERPRRGRVAATSRERRGARRWAVPPSPCPRLGNKARAARRASPPHRA